MLEQYDDVLKTDEVCEALRIGYNALYELLGSGKLKGYRNGRTWRIPKVAVQDYILGQVRELPSSNLGISSKKLLK